MRNRVNAGMCFLAIFTIVIVFASSCSNLGGLKEKYFGQSQITVDDAPSIVDSSQIVDEYVVLYGEVIPNRGIIEAMTAMGVRFNDARLVTNVMSYYVDFRNIRVGQKLRAVYSSDTTRFLRFDYIPSAVITHTVEDSVGTLVYFYDRKPTEFRTRSVRGRLINTLDGSLRGLDIDNSIVQVVNNALTSKISFRRDARRGDEFFLLLEEEFFEGERIAGKVLYVSYRGERAGFHEAYWYCDGDPQSSFNGLYTPEGEALISTKMRYPLDRMHVTSPFGMRIHPILGVRRFHNGVDLAGRSGAPVYSVKEGIVHSTGSDASNGKFVVLRHKNGYRSYYLHLSRILVRNGQHVGPRQIVGRVGSTGLSSGPHLHLSIRNPKGGWTDPMRMRMIAATKLEDERKENYKDQMEAIRDLRLLSETLVITHSRALPVI